MLACHLTIARQAVGPGNGKADGAETCTEQKGRDGRSDPTSRMAAAAELVKV